MLLSSTNLKKSTPPSSSKLLNESKSFQKALKTFQQAAHRVPAYQDFLAKNGVDPAKIRTLDDFKTLPPITKENYLKQYPLPDLLYDGQFNDSRIISMSSGSSGKPFFWFRGNQSQEDATKLCGDIFNQSFHTKEKNTLCIIAFAMGTWIAGTYVLNGVTELANQGHKIVSITPGINKGEIIKILREVSPYFEQTVIAGYPPFIKDVIDEALYENVNLPEINIKLLFAGENFSEKWRDYVLERIGKKNDLSASVSIYGTADAGIMGHETPFSIYTRRAAVANPRLFKKIFPDTTVLPTLVRYDPEIRFYETEGNNLLFTTNTSIPLVRYQILDKGRIISGKELLEDVKKAGLKPNSDILPSAQDCYIALYSRSDVSTTFYALNIYPENIKYGLEKPDLEKLITGKFILRTEMDDLTQQQSLHLYVELKKEVVPEEKIQSLIFDSTLTSLRQYNSEYHKLEQEIKHLAHPEVHLVEHAAEGFNINIKHRWTPKS